MIPSASSFGRSNVFLYIVADAALIQTLGGRAAFLIAFPIAFVEIRPTIKYLLFLLSMIPAINRFTCQVRSRVQPHQFLSLQVSSITSAIPLNIADIEAIFFRDQFF